MEDRLESFVHQIPQLSERKASELIDYFVYFLTVDEGRDGATAAAIDECFDLCRLQKYSNTSAHLSRHAKRVRGKTSRYVRQAKGVRLERSTELDVQSTLNRGLARVEASNLLRALLPKVGSAQEKAFLEEAIDCYEVGARRAAVVMTWLLTVHHMFEFVLRHHLSAFNGVLAKNTDKRVGVASVARIDDFSEIPEGKFIEFLRSARIVSNDVRKILDTKLGIRNSAAHPSSVTLSEVKTTDFVIDLVENVLLKYIV